MLSFVLNVSDCLGNVYSLSKCVNDIFITAQ